MTRRSDSGGGRRQRSGGRRGASAPRDAVVVAGTEVQPGHRRRFEIPVARVTTGDWLHLPVEVVHGVKPGPWLWLSGGIHGDELDGIEITRRVLTLLRPNALSGTVLGVPMVNMFGVITESRYLPDRRDLNRSFPGSPRGSLAARLANLFMKEIVARCSWGIDFHCGSDGRENLPQVRGDMEDEETRRLAQAFGAPISVHGEAPEGSLRRAAVERGARVLLYEGGEAGRFTSSAIEAGVEGVRRVLNALAMTRASVEPAQGGDLLARSTCWVRAGRSGVCRLDVALGQPVKKGQRLGSIGDALGDRPAALRACCEGVVIGRRVHPLVYQGEGVVHVAELDTGA